MDNEAKEILYQRQIDPVITAWNRIMPPCRLLDLVSMDDINQMYRIARSPSLAAKPAEKHRMLNEIMERRGFYKKYAGTNRIIYFYKYNPTFLCKVAFDEVALNDNKKEMINQEFLKPFCPKVYEVDPTGVIGLFERVRPIRNKEEFMSVADRIFDIIVNVFIGRYVLDDFGTKFYLNWGVRVGSCPVLLDFPYLYKLDGSKLYCNKPDQDSPTGYCGGEIDYDDGFNHLVCTKCGKTFFATELKNDSKETNTILIKKDEDIEMKVELRRGDTIIGEHRSNESTDTYKKPAKETRREYATRRNLLGLVVECKRIDSDEAQEKTLVKTPDPNGISFIDDRLRMSVELTKGEPRRKNKHKEIKTPPIEEAVEIDSNDTKDNENNIIDVEVETEDESNDDSIASSNDTVTTTIYDIMRKTVENPFSTDGDDTEILNILDEF